MAKTGRNELCHCGSGRKYKKCCEAKERVGESRNRMLMFVVGAAVVAAVVAGIASFTTERSTATRVWDPAHGHYHNANGVAVP